MNIGQLTGQAILDVSKWVNSAQEAIASVADLGAAVAAVGAASAVGIGSLIAVGVEVASSADRATAALGVMMKDTQAAASLMADIKQMAAATPFESADLIAGAQSLMSMGFAANEVIPTLTALGDAAAAAPSGMQAALPLIVRAFAQIRAKGKVSMEELSQLGENGVGAIGMIADSLGITVGEAIKKVESGSMGAAEGLNALMKGIHKNLGGLMVKQSQTLEGVFSTLSDTIKSNLGDVARPLVAALIEVIPLVSSMAGSFVTALAPMVDIIAATVRGIGALVVGFNSLSPEVKTFATIATGALASATIGAGLFGAALAILIPPVLGVAAAFAVLDTAMAPVLISIGAIGIFMTVAAGVAIAAISAIAAEWYVLYSAWLSDTAGMRSAMLAVWSIVQSGYAVIRGLASVISGMVGTWLEGTSQMEGSSNSLFGSIRQAATSAYTWMSNGFGAAIESISDALSNLRNAFIDTALSSLTAIQQLLAGLSKIPGMTGYAAEAQGRLTEAVMLLAGMRGQEFKFEFATPDTSGLSAWWQKVTTPEAVKPMDYSNVLSGLTPTEAEGGDGKQSPEMKALIKELEGIARSLERTDDVIREGVPKMRSSLADLIDAAEMGAWRQEQAFIRAGAIIGAGAVQAVDAFNEAVRAKLVNAAKSAGGIFMDAMGGLGQTINAAIEGFKSGGATGAIVAAVADMLSQNAAFQSLTASLNEQFAKIIESLNPLVKGIGMVVGPVMDIASIIMTSLIPVFDLVGRILGMISPALTALGIGLQGLGPLFQVVVGILEPLMPIVELAFRLLFRVMQGVSIVILSVVWGIGSAWNAILDIVTGLLERFNKRGNLDSAIDKLNSMKSDTDAVEDALQTLLTTTYDSAYANAEAAAQTAMMAEAAAEATESLTNVPSGYKVALARFEATQASTMSGAAAGMSSGGGGGVNITIGSLVAVAQDPDALLDAIEERAGTRQYRHTGTSLRMQAPRYSGGGNGP